MSVSGFPLQVLRQRVKRNHLVEPINEIEMVMHITHNCLLQFYSGVFSWFRPPGTTSHHSTKRLPQMWCYRSRSEGRWRRLHRPDWAHYLCDSGWIAPNCSWLAVGCQNDGVLGGFNSSRHNGQGGWPPIGAAVGSELVLQPTANNATMASAAVIQQCSLTIAIIRRCSWSR